MRSSHTFRFHGPGAEPLDEQVTTANIGPYPSAGVRIDVDTPDIPEDYARFLEFLDALGVSLS